MREQQLQEILSTFGVPQLRPGQSGLIDCAFNGQNALGVLPTGHGKSLCYQAAALLLGVGALLLLFTFVTPRIPLFRDPVTGSYGLQNQD